MFSLERGVNMSNSPIGPSIDEGTPKLGADYVIDIMIKGLQDAAQLSTKIFSLYLVIFASINVILNLESIDLSNKNGIKNIMILISMISGFVVFAISLGIIAGLKDILAIGRDNIKDEKVRGHFESYVVRGIFIYKMSLLMVILVVTVICLLLIFYR